MTIKRAHNRLTGASVESDGISELHLSPGKVERDKESDITEMENYFNFAKLALDINQGRGFTIANKLLQ